jgi:hypothetical protein
VIYILVSLRLAEHTALPLLARDQLAVFVFMFMLHSLFLAQIRNADVFQSYTRAEHLR